MNMLQSILARETVPFIGSRALCGHRTKLDGLYIREPDESLLRVHERTQPVWRTPREELLRNAVVSRYIRWKEEPQITEGFSGFLYKVRGLLLRGGLELFRGYLETELERSEDGTISSCLECLTMTTIQCAYCRHFLPFGATVALHMPDSNYPEMRADDPKWDGSYVICCGLDTCVLYAPPDPEDEPYWERPKERGWGKLVRRTDGTPKVEFYIRGKDRAMDRVLT